MSNWQLVYVWDRMSRDTGFRIQCLLLRSASSGSTVEPRDLYSLCKCSPGLRSNEISLYDCIWQGSSLLKLGVHVKLLVNNASYHNGFAEIPRMQSLRCRNWFKHVNCRIANCIRLSVVDKWACEEAAESTKMLWVPKKKDKVGRRLRYETFRWENERLHSKNDLEIDIRISTPHEHSNTWICMRSHIRTWNVNNIQGKKLAIHAGFSRVIKDCLDHHMTTYSKTYKNQFSVWSRSDPDQIYPEKLM